MNKRQEIVTWIIITLIFAGAVLFLCKCKPDIPPALWMLKGLLFHG